MTFSCFSPTLPVCTSLPVLSQCWSGIDRQLHSVQTLVSEQNLQIHSFRPSSVTASANTFSARTCLAIQDFLLCVWKPSPPTSWPETSNATATTTIQNDRKDTSRQDRDRNTTQTTNQKQPHPCQTRQRSRVLSQECLMWSCSRFHEHISC